MFPVRSCLVKSGQFAKLLCRVVNYSQIFGHFSIDPHHWILSRQAISPKLMNNFSRKKQTKYLLLQCFFAHKTNHASDDTFHSVNPWHCAEVAPAHRDFFYHGFASKSYFDGEKWVWFWHRRGMYGMIPASHLVVVAWRGPNLCLVGSDESAHRTRGFDPNKIRPLIRHRYRGLSPMSLRLSSLSRPIPVMLELSDLTLCQESLFLKPPYLGFWTICSIHTRRTQLLVWPTA